MSAQIYLDYAAASPLDESVVSAMQPYFTERFYNPSALYLSAKAVHKDMEGARTRIARAIGAKHSEIIFTAGGTEANNLAIRGVQAAFPDSHMVVSSIEHESVLVVAKAYNATTVPVNEQGIVDVSAITKAITETTVLVSVMHANNEIGTIQPIKDIAKAVSDIRRTRSKAGNRLPLYLHTDAAQSVNYLDVHVSRLGVDLMTVNGGKIYGPKQTGFLFVKTGTVLTPQTLGGGQERGFRSGTENVPGIMGLARAIEVVSQRKKDEVTRLQKLQKQFMSDVLSIPGVSINGSLKHRLPNNVHITLEGCDNERVMMELDERGIQCATGSACSASNDEPSHVLSAIGLSDASAQSSLRFSMGAQTTEADIETVIAAIKEIAKSL